MDLATIQNLKELGIGVTGMLILGYIVYLVLKQLQENRKDYTAFVQSNNHGNTERIVESTKAMTEVANAIQAHTRIIEKLTDKI
jgi:geranylgeranyl pyrophosphate synthase